MLVKFTDEPLGSGDIGIFQVDGALYIKQYQSDGLHSLNKHFKIMRRKSYDEVKTIDDLQKEVKKASVSKDPVLYIQGMYPTGKKAYFAVPIGE